MQEIEAKFYLLDREAFAARLAAAGAKETAERIFEQNLRFDNPAGELSATFQILRLRRDTRFRLTYKGPGELVDEVRRREEIEFEVSDFKAATALLERLGFLVVLVYEKYRTTYRLGELEIVIDETPLGDFTEFEGPDGTAIREASQALGLDWEGRINDSYAVLFDHARFAMGLEFRDMTFENFKDLEVTHDLLGILPADLGS